MNILYDNPADFHDITSGTSTGQPSYTAGPGYDYVTGLGSPMAELVVGSLESYDTLSLAAPTSATAGTPLSLTVTAENAAGGTDVGYLGTIHFTSSDLQAGLPANYTFTSADLGTHTFSVTLKTAGSESITATDTSTPAITGEVSGISVSPAAASQFVFSGLPSTTTAGVSQTVAVIALDPYGNVATGFAGSIQLTTSDPQVSLPENESFTAEDQGIDAFPLTFETAGSQSVTVVDTTLGIAATQAGIMVQPAAARTFTITGFPVVVTAGAARTVTVTAYDVYGNVATGYAGKVSLASSDPRADLPPYYTFAAADAGQHAFIVTLVTAGTQTITATDTLNPNFSATESNITVNPAAASILEVTGFPTIDTAGAAGEATVTAYDSYGNVATGYAGAASVTSSDPQADLPSRVNFLGTLGTATFNVTLDTAGTQTITATDTDTPGITGVESGITVHPAAAATLAIAGLPAAVTAGTANDVTVTAHDAYGNVATGYAGTVSLASSDPHAVLPPSYNLTGSDQGTHTFSIVFKSAGPQSLTATAAGAPSFATTDSGITVQPAAAQTLAVTGLPAAVIAGAAEPVTVTAYDAFDNVATGYAGTISFRSSDGHAVLPESFSFDAADAGTCTLSVVFGTMGSQSITATDTENSSITGTASGITVRAVPQITWSSPASIVYGTPLGSVQLDATANTAGTFTYLPAADTILDAGNDQTVSVIFTPSDGTDYVTTSANTAITVIKATPILQATDDGGPFDGSPFPASATIAGVDHAPATTLDGMTPTLTYFDGSGISGPSLGSAAPSAPGTYTALAAVPGDGNYAAASSPPVTFTIGKGAASLTLASSLGTAVFGQSVTFIAHVGAGAGTPTGAVTFADGTTPLATVALDGSSTATFTTTALSVGSHPISATYSGDADLLAVQSAPSSEKVDQTGTELAVFRNSVFKKKKLMSVRLTAQVEPSAPGGGMPSGLVTFELVNKIKNKDRVTRLGAAPVIGGEATVTLPASRVLHKAITIVYGGDSNDLASALAAFKTN